VMEGASPAEIPIKRDWNKITTINMRAARQLGLTIPPDLLEDAQNIVE
jgi:ABC-type uncharacterized transport system substrate-binding protein